MLVVTLMSCNVQPVVPLADIPIRCLISLPEVLMFPALLVKVMLVFPSFCFLHPFAASKRPSMITLLGMLALELKE